MKHTIGLVCLCLLPIASQGDEKKAETKITSEHYRVYRGNGEEVILERMLTELQRADVIFLGEEHNDPVAHHLQEAILVHLIENRNTAGANPRPLALSMEMFERDIQHILDEYLADLITEKHFKDSSRPWKNYVKDYRPLVEHAKKHGLPVIAANAPRRYVNLVGREGRDALTKLPNPHRRGLPPLPYGKASPAYEAKFRAIMEQMKAPPKKKDETKAEKKDAPKVSKTEPMKKEHKAPVRKFDMAKALAAQSLWDAAMAYSIASHLMRQPNAQILQINGSFHSEKKLGAPEHLSRYRPGTSMAIVTIKAEKAFPKFDLEKMTGLGDFVIVTDASLPRSYSTTPPGKHGSPKKTKPKVTEKRE